jgi:hypothetical protein
MAHAQKSQCKTALGFLQSSLHSGYVVIDPAIEYLNKDSAMPNRMPHFRESEKWPDQ